MPKLGGSSRRTSALVRLFEENRRRGEGVAAEPPATLTKFSANSGGTEDSSVGDRSDDCDDFTQPEPPLFQLSSVNGNGELHSSCGANMVFNYSDYQQQVVNASKAASSSVTADGGKSSAIKLDVTGSSSSGGSGSGSANGGVGSGIKQCSRSNGGAGGASTLDTSTTMGKGLTNGHGPPGPPPPPPKPPRPTPNGILKNGNHKVSIKTKDKPPAVLKKPQKEPVKLFHINGFSQEGHVAMDQINCTFVGSRNVQDADTLREHKIVSSKGTVRGFKNRVRAGIATFIDQEELMNYRVQEKGKIIIYTTSMRIIRGTYEKCQRTKNILQTHMVCFEERDVFMSKENQRQLQDRLGIDAVILPQVFADGQHLGGAEEFELKNESGELRKLFTHFQKVSRPSQCATCGGYRFIPCAVCHGSKKSLRRNHFTEEFQTLRCVVCDDNGLMKCDKCNSADSETRQS